MSSRNLPAAILMALSRLRSSSASFGRGRQGAAATLIAVAALFPVAGVVTSYWGTSPAATISEHATSHPPAHSGSDDQMLARLKDYTHSIGAEAPTTKQAAGEPLPDVNTMIDRLAARLESTPEDIDGWRMLGWSYFNTARYEQAAAAYARALELDPNSAELERAYEQAKAKSSESDLKAAPPLQTGDVAKNADGPVVDKVATSDAVPPREQDATLRSMADSLADRLESSPRHVEGWALLMRSRVVLGEKEAAATAFRKALEIFKDDPAVSGRISAAAVELGLNIE